MKRIFAMALLLCLVQLISAQSSEPYFVEIVSPQPGDTITPGAVSGSDPVPKSRFAIRFRTNAFDNPYEDFNVGIWADFTYPDTVILANGDTLETRRKFSVGGAPYSIWEDGRQDVYEFEAYVPMLNDSRNDLRLRLHAEDHYSEVDVSDSIDFISYHQPNPDLNETFGNPPITLRPGAAARYGVSESKSKILRVNSNGTEYYSNHGSDFDRFLIPVVPGNRVRIEINFTAYGLYNSHHGIPHGAAWFLDSNGDHIIHPYSNGMDGYVFVYYCGNGFSFADTVVPPQTAYVRFSIGGNPAAYSIRAFTSRVNPVRPGGPRPGSGSISSNDSDPDGIVDLEQADHFAAEVTDEQVGLADANPAPLHSFGIRSLRGSKPTFEVTLDQAASFRLTIHDLLGREIMQHLAPVTNAGIHRVDLTNRSSQCPKGFYFVTLESAERRISKKIILAQ